MAKFNCAGCQKEHDDSNWKNTTYIFENGERSGWFCSKYFRPTFHEWTTDSIREQRKTFRKDLLQPYQSGEPNREFIKEYPHESKRYFTPKQIKKANKRAL